MTIRMFYRGLVYLIFIQLITGCKPEVLEPDSVEKEPLFVRGIIDTDSFSFSNENDFVLGESMVDRVGDTLKRFAFSFADTRTGGKKIEIRFLINIRRVASSIDSAITTREYPYYSRNVWGIEFDRSVEILWYEDGSIYSSSEAFQNEQFIVTRVDDISWDGIRYKRVNLRGACGLIGDPGGGGRAKQLQDFSAQIVYKDG